MDIPDATGDERVADREWRLVSEEARSGPMNMALDEVAAETVAVGGPPTLRVYRWRPSALSLGYHQDPDTVDWEYCDREEIDVTRRPTGGGGIYHDEYGDISYSIVAPADELPGDLMDCYRLLCVPVLDAFERMGVSVEFVAEEMPAVYDPACYLRALDPAHDLVVPGSSFDDGHPRKISGNAQYRRRDAVVQHGSLTFSVRAARHLMTFVEPSATPEAFEARVTGIDDHADIGRDVAVATVASALGDWADADEGSWTDAELDAARSRAREKYDSDQWTRRRPQAGRSG